MERLVSAGTHRVVGTRQVLKAIKAGTIATVYVTNDADTYIYQQIIRAAEENHVPTVRVETKKELGKACGINVPTAAAGVLK